MPRCRPHTHTTIAPVTTLAPQIARKKEARADPKRGAADESQDETFNTYVQCAKQMLAEGTINEVRPL